MGSAPPLPSASPPARGGERNGAQEVVDLGSRRRGGADPRPSCSRKCEVSDEVGEGFGGFEVCQVAGVCELD